MQAPLVAIAWERSLQNQQTTIIIRSREMILGKRIKSRVVKDAHWSLVIGHAGDV
jgi:hypothetical protein